MWQKSSVQANFGAVAAAVVFFWKNRKARKAADDAWNQASDSISPWSKTAAEKAGETTDKLADKGREAAGDVAATVK